MLTAGFSIQFWGQDAEGQFEVTQVSNFHIWVQNPMGVLPTKFHPDPINTSQVTPFLMSIISFSGKRLLTPKGVTGFHSLGGFFRGSYLVSIAAIKSLCHRSLFCGVFFFQVLITSVPTAGLSSNCNTRCILPLPIIPPNFSFL